MFGATSSSRPPAVPKISYCPSTCEDRKASSAPACTPVTREPIAVASGPGARTAWRSSASTSGVSSADMPPVLASIQPGRSTTAIGRGPPGAGRMPVRSATWATATAAASRSSATTAAASARVDRRARADQPAGRASGKVPVDHRGGAAHRLTVALSGSRSGRAPSRRRPGRPRPPTRCPVRRCRAARTRAAGRRRRRRSRRARARRCNVPVFARTVPGLASGRSPRGRRACRRTRPRAGRRAGRPRCRGFRRRRPGRPARGRRRGPGPARESPLPSTRVTPVTSTPAWARAVGDGLRRSVEAGRQVAGDRDLPGEGLGEHRCPTSTAPARPAARWTPSAPWRALRARRGLAQADGGADAESVGERPPGVGAGGTAAPERAGAGAGAVDGGRGDRCGIARRRRRRAPSRGRSGAAVQGVVDHDAGDRRGGRHHGAHLRGEIGHGRRPGIGLVDGVVRDRVGSPPPTRTTSPGVAPATTLVAMVAVGPTVVSTAAEVRSFAVEAGAAGAAAFRSSSTVPVRTSSTDAVRPLPRAGAESSGANAELSAAGSGVGAVAERAASTGLAGPSEGRLADAAAATAGLSGPDPVSAPVRAIPPPTSRRTRKITPSAMRRRNRPVLAVDDRGTGRRDAAHPQRATSAGGRRGRRPH